MRKKCWLLASCVLLGSIMSGCGKNTDPIREFEDEQIESNDDNIVETVNDTADMAEISEETDIADITEISVITESVEVVDTETNEDEESAAGQGDTEINNMTFTYTDMNVTMYARSTVNVRDLPSTAGNKVSSLASNEQVTVTGQCNETGWYRISYNGTDAYVSNSYLTNDIASETIKSEEEEITIEFDFGDAISTAELHGYDITGQYQVSEEEICIDTDLLPLVNADRAANGVGALTWSDELAQYCADRISVLVYNDANGLDIHTGWTEWENVVRYAYCSEEANDGWIKSSSHHKNRINSQWTQYGAACYYYYDESGTIHTFWIEAFK